ncbi:hypothetical protein J6590_052685 [Homalodisca vitripennis]|nr:hypothetical protein J6590_052685 [Homalodisca vitripennis]
MPVQWVRRTGSARDKADNYSVIRLPVSRRADLVAGMVPAERWTSAPTYINIIPPVPPPLPVPETPRKRRSSPGRLDLNTIERIKSELQETEKKMRGEDT